MFHRPKWLSRVMRGSSDRLTINSAFHDEMWQGMVKLQHLLHTRTSEDVSMRFSVAALSHKSKKTFKDVSRLSAEIVSSLKAINELVDQLSSGVYPLSLLKDRIEPLLESGSSTGLATSDLQIKNDCVRRLRQIHVELARFMLSTKTFLDQPISDAILGFPSHSTTFQYGSPLLSELGFRCCEPGTRIHALGQLQNWIKNPKARGMRGVIGAVGAGKSTVAYTLCRWMSESNIPTVSCFCSPYGLGKTDLMDIVVSISHQLAQLLPAFRARLSRELMGRAEVFTIPYLEATHRLIVGPLMVCSHTVPGFVVIVIDGLEVSHSVKLDHSILDVLLALSITGPIRIVCTARDGSNLNHWVRDNARGDMVAGVSLDGVESSVQKGDGNPHPTDYDDRPASLDSESQTLADRLLGKPRNALQDPSYVSGDPHYDYERIEKVSTSGGATLAKTKASKLTSASLLALDRCTSQTEVSDASIIIRILACTSEPLDIAILSLITGYLSSAMISNLSPAVYLMADQSRVALNKAVWRALSDRTLSGRFHCDTQHTHSYLAHWCFDYIKSSRLRMHEDSPSSYRDGIEVSKGEEWPVRPADGAPAGVCLLQLGQTPLRGGTN
ncbi:Vegetative incompatibility protein HET-E-1 [Ceratobasidium sp. AG-Ba]|nr:Vegetative incompatibility protein HET-E-1 [Ceratobasidium sp. AG-Ba]